jgi:hypothetical protein
MLRNFSLVTIWSIPSAYSFLPSIEIDLWCPCLGKATLPKVALLARPLSITLALPG